MSRLSTKNPELKFKIDHLDDYYNFMRRELYTISEYCLRDLGMKSDSLKMRNLAQKFDASLKNNFKAEKKKQNLSKIGSSKVSVDKSRLENVVEEEYKDIEVADPEIQDDPESEQKDKERRRVLKCKLSNPRKRIKNEGLVSNNTIIWEDNELSSSAFIDVILDTNTLKFPKLDKKERSSPKKKEKSSRDPGCEILELLVKNHLFDGKEYKVVISSYKDLIYVCMGNESLGIQAKKVITYKDFLSYLNPDNINDHCFESELEKFVNRLELNAKNEIKIS